MIVNNAVENKCNPDWQLICSNFQFATMVAKMMVEYRTRLCISVTCILFISIGSDFMQFSIQTVSIMFTLPAVFQENWIPSLLAQLMKSLLIFYCPFCWMLC